jgi:hypothetical protein
MRTQLLGQITSEAPSSGRRGKNKNTTKEERRGKTFQNLTPIILHFFLPLIEIIFRLFPFRNFTFSSIEVIHLLCFLECLEVEEISIAEIYVTVIALPADFVVELTSLRCIWFDGWLDAQIEKDDDGIVDANFHN